MKSEAIEYYYLKQNGSKSDSLIFIQCSWDCPIYKKIYAYLDEYPFLEKKKNYNYIGDNSEKMSLNFALEPHFPNKDQKEDTTFAPPFPARDSSSLLIYSISGFKVVYETCTAPKVDDIEKKIIIENLLGGIQDMSCIYKLTMIKLATIDGISRFIGQIMIVNAPSSSWYIADIKDEQCVITILEGADDFTSVFDCAYSFGLNNLPDVYVFINYGNYAKADKYIYYKTEKNWVMTSTQEEYKGDCLDESVE